MAAAELINLAALRAIAVQYDFSIHGGAVGSISLRQKLPKSAILIHSVIEVLTAPTSGGSATIAVNTEAAGDVLTATAIGSAPWSSTGLKTATPVIGTASGYIKTTADRDITITVATAALTAGKFNIFLFYLMNTAG